MPIGEPAGHKEEFTGQKKEEMGMHYIPFPPFLSTTPSTFQIDSLFLAHLLHDIVSQSPFISFYLISLQFVFTSGASTLRHVSNSRFSPKFLTCMSTCPLGSCFRRVGGPNAAFS